MVCLDPAVHRHEQQLRSKARLVVQLAEAKLRAGEPLALGLQNRLQAASDLLEGHHGSKVPDRVLEHMGWKWHDEGDGSKPRGKGKSGGKNGKEKQKNLGNGTPDAGSSKGRSAGRLCSTPTACLQQAKTTPTLSVQSARLGTSVMALLVLIAAAVAGSASRLSRWQLQQAQSSLA